MFCPTCGSEERQASQYCRACGVDLRAVRVSLERPDSITASAVSARDEIGRAIGDRIRAVKDAAELKVVAETVLPEVEKFLESPEEKRLRRVRAGTIISATGLGAGTLGLILSAALSGPDIEAAFWIGGLGITAFTLGLGFIVNGLLFTKPRKALDDRAPDASMAICSTQPISHRKLDQMKPQCCDRRQLPISLRKKAPQLPNTPRLT